MDAQAKTTTILEDKIITAHHEAAHAVVTWFLGRKLFYSSIIPDKQRGAKGSTLDLALSDFEPNLPPEEIGIDITILLAGVAAEDRLLDGAWDMWGARRDYERVVPWAKRWAYSQRPEDLPEGLLEELELHPVKFPKLGDEKSAEAIRDFIEMWGGSAWDLIARDDIWACVEAVAQALLDDYIGALLYDVIEEVIRKTLGGLENE